MQAAAGNQVILMAPGNYGEKFFETEMGISPGKAVLCSNYVKAAVQMLQEEGVKKVLFASHAGKLVRYLPVWKIPIPGLAMAGWNRWNV